MGVAEAASEPSALGEAFAWLAEATSARKGQGRGFARPHGRGWSSQWLPWRPRCGRNDFFETSFYFFTKSSNVIVSKFNLGFLGANPTSGTKFRIINYFL